MRRVVVVGSSGAGKSTLAAELADRLGVTHVELDALYHRAGWTPAPEDEFRVSLRNALDEADDRCDGWTACGNYYDRAAAIHVERADTLVWLDLSRATVMRRLIPRTVGRAISRRELWNGNREPLTNFYRWDPELNVVRWAWVKHAQYRADYGAKSTDGSWNHLVVHRLRSPPEVDAFLTMISSP